jgi:hypothetical protein
MQNFLKIAENINVLPLQIALIRQPSLFGRRTARKDGYEGSPHLSMTDIWVRYNHWDNLSKGMDAFNGEHDSVWYPEAAYIPEVRPICMHLMAITSGERLGGVLITKVPPGGKIAPHVDRGWHAEYYDKYYVPIQNDEGAVFGFEDGVIRPQLGEAYWFYNGNSHWVENNSQRDRIALIVCIRTNKEA